MLCTLMSDKSFLQSLNKREIEILNQRYNVSIPPVYPLEIWGDIGKEGYDIQRIKNLVGAITISKGIISYYLPLCWLELAGDIIKMDLSPIFVPCTLRIVIQEMIKEARRENFSYNTKEITHLSRVFSSLAPRKISNYLEDRGEKNPKFNDLKDIKDFSEQELKNQDPYELFKWALEFLWVPSKYHPGILTYWQSRGSLPLHDFAPYTAYVLTLDIFFHHAITTNFISLDRPSNRTDMEYCYYLPFTKMFVSGDKLHSKVVPLFINNNQEFLWGPDLKKTLN